MTIEPLPILLLGRGGNVDGQQRQLANLAAGLDRARFPLTVAVDRAGPTLDRLREDGVDASMKPMRSWRAIFHMLRRGFDAAALLELARSRNTRIVHANDHWRAPYARYVARRLSIPYVVHVRGPLAARDIHKHRLNDADAIIAIARRYADDLVAAGVAADRICLVDDSVDLASFDPKRARPGLLGPKTPGDRVTVGLVGSISPFKRVPQFLDVVAALPRHVVPKARFLIIGEETDPDYRRSIEAAIVRLQLGSLVTLAGRIASDRMPDAMAGLDLLVTLSGGSVMFEAMALGKPVLSIRADGRHSEHTRHHDTAICVDSEDASIASQALATLICDAGLRQRLGHAARRRVEERLSATAMVEATESVYRRVTARASEPVATFA